MEIWHVVLYIKVNKKCHISIHPLSKRMLVPELRVTDGPCGCGLHWLILDISNYTRLVIPHADSKPPSLAIRDGTGNLAVQDVTDWTTALQVLPHVFLQTVFFIGWKHMKELHQMKKTLQIPPPMARISISSQSKFHIKIWLEAPSKSKTRRWKATELEGGTCL